MSPVENLGAGNYSTLEIGRSLDHRVFLCSMYPYCFKIACLVCIMQSGGLVNRKSLLRKSCVQTGLGGLSLWVRGMGSGDVYNVKKRNAIGAEVL